MSVRAITPYVTAAKGRVQIYRDADGYDLVQDSQWDLVDGGDFYTDPALEKMPVRRRARGLAPSSPHVAGGPGTPAR